MNIDNWLDDSDLKRVLTKIDQNYTVIEYLGGGSHAKVYLVRHKHFGEEKALKIMDIDFIRQKYEKQSDTIVESKLKEIKQRFLNEANLYRAIDHPNIVTIDDVGIAVDEGNNIEIPYLIMSYIKGENLAQTLRTNNFLELNLVKRICKDILSALSTIHQRKVLHRDIKPANIMMDERNGNAVLIDFGIAKDELSALELTLTGSALGTPIYMAPEQFEGITSSPQTDIYSFGVVLYEMLAGEAPFERQNASQLMFAHLTETIPNVRKKNSGLPAGIENVIYKAMAKKPEDRFKSAEEFLAALTKFTSPQKMEPKSKIIGKYGLYFAVSPFIIGALLMIYFLIWPVGKSTGSINPWDFIRSVKGAIEKCEQLIVTQKNQVVRMLKSQGEAVEKHKELIASTNRYIKNSEWDKASEALDQARKIKDTDEARRLTTVIAEKKAQAKEQTEYERRNGVKRYHAIKGSMTLSKYLNFKSRYPESINLKELKGKLKAADNVLPPDKYWDRSIQKNSKGFYELTFGDEHNRHLMIYIPGENIWIDKYEVSWAQFKRFLIAEGSEASPRKSSEYIPHDDEFPAVVSYEDAVAYCFRYGLKLPTEAEWMYAASGGKDIVYPWGNELPDAGGEWRANFKGAGDGYEGTAPVHRFEAFESPVGTVNMAGNVWEWVVGKVLKGGGIFSEIKYLTINERGSKGSVMPNGFRCLLEER